MNPKKLIKVGYLRTISSTLEPPSARLKQEPRSAGWWWRVLRGPRLQFLSTVLCVCVCVFFFTVFGVFSAHSENLKPVYEPYRQRTTYQEHEPAFPSVTKDSSMAAEKRPGASRGVWFRVGLGSLKAWNSMLHASGAKNPELLGKSSGSFAGLPPSFRLGGGGILPLSGLGISSGGCRLRVFALRASSSSLLGCRVLRL